MPHKQTNPNVQREREISRFVARELQMPHDKGLTEPTNIAPASELPIDLTPRSFRKIPQPKG